MEFYNPIGFDVWKKIDQSLCRIRNISEMSVNIF